MAWIDRQVKLDMEQAVLKLKERSHKITQQEYVEKAIREKNERKF
jgi:hypothetical protein